MPDLPENTDRILHYALTEMVNNAIDHSEATRVVILLSSDPARVRFEVLDDGVGIFDHLSRRLALPDRMSALQELSKGKVTTQPDRHRGEGIFFVSKIADCFRIESGGLSWTVDNERSDMAVGAVTPATGTRVHFEVKADTTRTLAGLFGEYTRDHEFSRTRIVVRLFEIGVRFISRSEAKRLLHGLEKFREIVLDFSGVTTVGQGFADEVFRVWAAANPEIRILPENMIPEVAFMVERAGKAPR